MTYGIVVPHPGESAGVGMNLEGSNRMGHDSFLTFATLGVLILYGEESLRSRLIRQIYRVHSRRCKHSSFILSLFWILYLPHSLTMSANKTDVCMEARNFDVWLWQSVFYDPIDEGKHHSRKSFSRRASFTHAFNLITTAAPLHSSEAVLSLLIHIVNMTLQL